MLGSFINTVLYSINAKFHESKTVVFDEIFPKVYFTGVVAHK